MEPSNLAPGFIGAIKVAAYLFEDQNRVSLSSNLSLFLCAVLFIALSFASGLYNV
jgi:hypothetical protein